MVAPVRTVSAPKILSDLVMWEEELAYSREIAGTVHKDTVTVLGTPLALDANSKMVPWLADNSLTCIGFAITARPAATAADTTGDIQYIRRTAILKDSGIVWPAGVTAPNKAAALASVEARGVVARAAL